MTWEDPDPADVVSVQTDRDWEALLRRYRPNHISRPLERCLEVARAGGARSVVVETRYLDVDYRSEYSSFFSKTFADIADSTHRLHFFARSVRAADITTLSAAVRASYLGYVIIRPSPLGRVGRTMLRPPPELKAVQTVVEESIDFFGQRLTIEAVPFAQQDTQFGRCAHVAAWICHYAAFRRGDVERRPMADFGLMADPSVAEGRPIPSQGLTGLQLSNLMREFDLPPILYRMGTIQSSGLEPPVPEHEPGDDPGTWDTRAVAVLCRFLNSGYPVLVGTHDHAFVIVGYERSRRDGEAWITFVRHDDQRGPYLRVENIRDDVDPDTGDRHAPWQLLLAPVPPKLWLLPEAAERIGRALLLRYEELEGSGLLAEVWDRKRLSFRTTAMSGTRFKEAAARRGLDASTARELRLARLSRFVWVVEAVDRDARATGRPSVLGEVVFDSTSSDVSPNALVLRVPGAMLITQTDGTIRSPLPTATKATRSAGLFQP